MSFVPAQCVPSPISYIISHRSYVTHSHDNPSFAPPWHIPSAILSFLNDADRARTSLHWAGGWSLIQPPSRSIPGRIIRRRRVKLITLPLVDVLHFPHTQLARYFEGLILVLPT